MKGIKGSVCGAWFAASALLLSSTLPWPACARTLEEALGYVETRTVVEVRVSSEREKGLGWAVSTQHQGVLYCAVLTPFHVVGDPATGAPYRRLRVHGHEVFIGLEAQIQEVLHTDLALLLLTREGNCPFVEAPGGNQQASGLWLVRLSERGVREAIQADAAAGLSPETPDFAVASLSVTGEHTAGVAKGWSGSTVYREGERIGMVSRVRQNGRQVVFYTPAAFVDELPPYVRLFGPPDAEPPPRDLPQVGGRFRDCVQCPEMVVVPGGDFVMGSLPDEAGRDGDEGPARAVTLGGLLAVGRFEVSRGEFHAFVEAAGHDVGRGCWTRDRERWQFSTSGSYRAPGFEQTAVMPVVCVNWEDAKAYVEWLSDKAGKPYRLLTESEWEYVARAGQATPYHTGPDISPTQARFIAVADATASATAPSSATAQPDAFEPNGFGLHHTLGNVWEWTEDCWNDRYVGAPATDAPWTSGDCSRRVLRGGSYLDDKRYLRAANRLKYKTATRLAHTGFRVARSLSR